MKSATKISAASLCAAIAFVPAALSAQDRGPSLYDACAQIEDDTARLACFDETYARENVLIAEREEAERVERIENFGLTPRQINERAEREAEAAGETGEVASATAAEPNEDGEFVTVVTEVTTDARGDFVMFLENGQIWRSTSNKSFRGRVRDGSTVTIRKIWSGGFRMTIEGRRGFLGVVRMR